MKITILRVAKAKVPWADQAVQEYLKRITQGWKLDEQVLKLAPKGEVLQRQQQESAQILQQLKEGDYLIVLDERGEQISSEVFAGWLKDAMDNSVKRVVFAIGGPFGHDPMLRTKAHKILGFSPMVLNHELVRVLLAEQLYRASTIIWGGNYHH
jgi:23S rRNA (pseudouridine1915-N3)-methyltransferase